MDSHHGVRAAPERTYSYRWTGSHICSIVWLALPVFWLSKIDLRGFPTNDPSAPVFISVMAGVAAMFIVIGIYFQLRGWNEKIVMENDHLVWFDCFGRKRISAPYEAIYDLQTKRGKAGMTLKVLTSAGTIRIYSAIRGYEELKTSLEFILFQKGQGPSSQPI
ncbi:MAG: hypothetical protein JSS72_03640 [Armatimonadetes bacterium]|nr:hypothetical protein [Armatimonadota bacterium]